MAHHEYNYECIVAADDDYDNDDDDIDTEHDCDDNGSICSDGKVQLIYTSFVSRIHKFYERCTNLEVSIKVLFR